MDKNNLYSINEPGNTFEVHKDHRIVSPILWNRNGEFRVVPTPVLQNIVDLLIAYRAVKGKVTAPVINIMWSQGIPISNLAGRALVGE